MYHSPPANQSQTINTEIQPTSSFFKREVVLVLYVLVLCRLYSVCTGSVYTSLVCPDVLSTGLFYVYLYRQ